ncbi:MAG: glycosyltransferase family 4 protein [candidate division WOR-3 bacterium]
MGKKILFCWPEISGYMSACWKELLNYPDIELLVICLLPDETSYTNFSTKIMDGIPSRLISKQDLGNYYKIKRIIAAYRPDIIIISGWNINTYKRIAYDKDFDNAIKILAMDNQFHNNIRQWIGKFVLRSYLKKFKYAWVPGGRSWEYAKFLGFKEKNIIKGLLGIDFVRISNIWNMRYNIKWPKSFLFVGRYIKIKGIHILISAYSKYRNYINDPWPLYCCGTGPLKYEIDKISGIKDLGFIQPEDLFKIFLQSGVFVMPSLRDAWPLAVVEACAAGLPILCTNVCGSSDEVVKNYYNGIIIPSNNIDALTKALCWFHNNYDKIPEMGKRSISLAEPYSAKNWASHFLEYVKTF